MPWTTHIATTNKLHPDNKNIILGHMHNPSISCCCLYPVLVSLDVHGGLTGVRVQEYRGIMLYGCVYYFGTNYSLNVRCSTYSVPLHIGIKLSFISKTRTWYTNIFAINNIWYIKWSGLFICCLFFVHIFPR